LKALYEQLKEYGESEYYPYHMPGHKRRQLGCMPEEILQIDITEIEGFDNLHQPEDILRSLQEKAARLYGAEESFYLVNGSTCGILSAISAALPYGGHLLMARNSHKAAYHAAYLRNLTVSYLYPTLLSEYDICDVITPKQVKAALEAEPDIEAVFVVSPTYEGRIADIAGIAEVVHEKGLPLIVDEAHGAHLGLTKSSSKEKDTSSQVLSFHANSCQLGADVVIHSVHKTLPAMTQTALLHVNGNIINRDRLRRFLHIYQSSSPSYVLMASIDNALRLVEKQGEALFLEFQQNFTQMLEILSDCKFLQFSPMDGAQDMGKLVISSKRIGLPGQRIYDILLQEYHLQLEMAAGSYCLAMFTIGDTREAYERMCYALLSIDRDIAEGRIAVEADCVEQEQPAGETECATRQLPLSATQDMNYERLPLSAAWDKDNERIPLQDAIDRYVAEFINLYPPGIPLLVPGEMLEEAMYSQLLQYLNQGLNVQGVSAKAPHLVKVLK